MRNMNFRLNWDFYARCALAIAAFLFVLYRVFNVNMIGDEWGMLKDSIKPGLEALITFQHKDTQSHFLQGLCAIPFFKFLPFEEIVSVRFASLLMFPVYAWAGFRFSKLFEEKWFRVLFFAAWIGPEIVLEYFGLGRGYAFLLAGFGVSFLGLLESYSPMNSPEKRDFWTKVSILAAACAMLALLTFSYGYFMITVFLLARYWQETEGNLKTKLAAVFKRGSFVIWTGIILFIFFLPRYLVLKQMSVMQWGGTNNFVSDTFVSVVGCAAYIDSFYSKTVFIVGLTVFAVCLMDLLYWIAVEIESLSYPGKYIYLPYKRFSLSVLFLFGIVVISQLAFWIFNMQFPLERTMLYLWPAIVLLAGFAWERYYSGPIRWLNVLMLCGVLGMNICSYNTYRTYKDQKDAQNREIAFTLRELSAANGKPLVVGMSDSLRYTIWYYLENDYDDMPVHPQLKNHPVFELHGNRLFTYSLNYGYQQMEKPSWHYCPGTDYYLIYPHEPTCETLNKQLMELEPVKYFKKSDVTLYKAKQPDKPVGHNSKQCMICGGLNEIAGALGKTN